MKRKLPRRVSWGELISDYRLFPSNRRKMPNTYPDLEPASWRGRYAKHNAFLRRRRRWIETFADVGCSFERGAPTTIQSKEALGKGAKAYAVDIQKFEEKTARSLRRRGIRPLSHDIRKTQLPFECDAIAFRNVSYHMTQHDRRLALVNIWKSLREGGYLLGATDLDPETYKRSQFVLRKRGGGFVLVFPETMEELV
jgi:SAM-dependent methyltransferase